VRKELDFSGNGTTKRFYSRSEADRLRQFAVDHIRANARRESVSGSEDQLRSD
jgi:hypothetical protein